MTTIISSTICVPEYLEIPLVNLKESPPYVLRYKVLVTECTDIEKICRGRTEVFSYPGCHRCFVCGRIEVFYASFLAHSFHICREILHLCHDIITASLCSRRRLSVPVRVYLLKFSTVSQVMLQLYSIHKFFKTQIVGFRVATEVCAMKQEQFPGKGFHRFKRHCFLAVYDELVEVRADRTIDRMACYYDSPVTRSYKGPAFRPAQTVSEIVAIPPTEVECERPKERCAGTLW